MLLLVSITANIHEDTHKIGLWECVQAFTLPPWRALCSWTPWEKGKDECYFFFLCSLCSYSNCIETLFFYPSFFQNAPMNFTDLLDEECLRNWRPAFPKMEKTDGRQAPWYSLV